MSEVVGEFTGKQLGATYFRGSKPIDAVWATRDIEVTGASVMRAGFGIGDHRLFVVDFRLESMIGNAPPKIVRAAARRLNTKIPRIADKYTETVEEKILEHQLNSKLVQAQKTSQTVQELRERVDKIDRDSKQYMLHAEKTCRKMKSGRIPFSPEAAVWIRRRQAYESLLKLKAGRIRNKSNCKRAAIRCGIKHPLSLKRRELLENSYEYVRRSANTSRGMVTGTGGNTCNIACQLHGRKRIGKQRNRSWQSFGGRRSARCGDGLTLSWQDLKGEVCER